MQCERAQIGGFNVTAYQPRENGEGFYGVKYSHDARFIGATLSNGALRVYNGADCAVVGRSKFGQGFDDVPSCCVRFRPTGDYTEENIWELAAVSSAGGVFGFSVDCTDADNVFLDRTFRLVEEGNDTITCDYSPDGLLLATAGADRNVRIYDLARRQLRDVLNKGHDQDGHSRPAHTNRIFCAKFINATTLVTGGWENPVQVWDMRTGRAEKQIGGPHVATDAIDVLPNQQHIIIGSARPERQIQVFDFLSCREIVDQSERLSAPLERAPITAVKYHEASASVWTATSRPEQIVCLDFTSGAIKARCQTPSVVFGLDPCPNNGQRCVAVGMRELLWHVDLQV